MPALSAYENNDEFYGGEAVAADLSTPEDGSVATVRGGPGEKGQRADRFTGSGNTGGRTRERSHRRRRRRSSEEPGPGRNRVQPTARAEQIFKTNSKWNRGLMGGLQRHG